MSAPAHAPPAPAKPASKIGGWIKGILLGVLGLGGGIAGTYATAVVDRAVKPPKPVANFAVAADGLTVTCDNRASGESGWWDFGDGTPLEPFAEDKPVSHAYTKAGSYTVKLTVRNYFGDENERTVPVDVGAAAKDAPAPKIAAFAVQPVSPAAVAPATFRLSAEVANAGACVWDLGDGRVEVTDGGKIDRLVTFEKPGTFAVSLVAHNGKLGAKQSGSVKVEAPREGTTMAVLKVTDSGTKIDGLTTVESVSVHVPTPNDKAATAFSKTLNARAGFTINGATAVDAPGSVKNLKVAVAADRRSVAVTGEWTGDLKATNKAAGGSDALVRVRLNQERTVAQAPAVTMVTGMFAQAGPELRASLPLPPAPVGVAGAKREYLLEVRTVQGGKSQTILQAPVARLPWQTKQQGTNWTYSAQPEGETVVVTAAPSLALRVRLLRSAPIITSRDSDPTPSTRPMANELRPLSLKREGDGLKIEWSDGVSTVVPWRKLRSNCPCASCNEERGKPADPFRVLTPQEVAAGAPAPVAMVPVGHYAYQIRWNDGHDTGIYPLELLRKLSTDEK